MLFLLTMQKLNKLGSKENKLVKWKQQKNQWKYKRKLGVKWTKTKIKHLSNGRKDQRFSSAEGTKVKILEGLNNELNRLLKT